MNSVLGARGAMGYVLGRGAGAAAAQWWLSGGVSAANAIVAYQPIGAASLAASYTNLANPGTYDAAPGAAPTFAAATGWTFDGSTQYLATGVVRTTANYSLIIRFSNGTFGALIGGSDRFGLGCYWFGDQIYAANGISNYIFAPAMSSGVLALSGTAVYRDGAAAHTVNAGTTYNNQQIGIGRFIGSGNYGAAAVQAVAIYNTTLSAAQVAAISSAMSGL